MKGDTPLECNTKRLTAIFMQGGNMHNQNVVKNQIEYCNSKNLPLFISTTGRCDECGRDITEVIDEEKAESCLITFCPFCHKSFVG